MRIKWRLSCFFLVGTRVGKILTCPACGSLGKVGDKKTLSQSDRRTFMPLLKSFLLQRMQSEACFKPVIDNLDPLLTELLTHSEFFCRNCYKIYKTHVCSSFANV